MLLPISSIKPAPDPIRKSWDEDKLNELAQSIAEQGLIVPIKVRPHPELEACSAHKFEALSTGQDFDDIDEQGDCIECRDLCNAFWGQDNLEHRWFEYEEGEIQPARPFEVVYGHRRLEAVRRNGVTEMECIVEGVDDTEAMIQALIENVQREDVQPLDKARAIKNLQDKTGWSFGEIQRRGIMDDSVSSLLTSLLSEPEDIQRLVANATEGNRSGAQGGRSLPEGKVSLFTYQASRSAILDKDERREVLEKSATEQLGATQTRRLAQAVAAAPSPEAKKVLLNTEYSPAFHDPEHIKARAQTYGAHDPLYRTDNGKTQQKTWDNAPEVKMIIDGVINAAKSWTMLIAEIRRMVQVGKMAPEGRQFTASKLRNLAQTLTAFADELEQEKELEHA